MSRNYTATLASLTAAIETMAVGQTLMQETLAGIARSQERLVDLLLTQSKTVSTATSPAPAAAPAGKAATSGKAKDDAKDAKAPKPVFTHYLRNGDLCVGLLCPSDVDLDDVLSTGARDAVHARMLEAHRDAHVWADDSGRLSQFRKAPKAQRRDGYAVMRIGRPRTDAEQASMAKAAENVLCPVVTKSK